MTDLIGQMIGNYRIESLLGVGGMGQVFRAEHRFLNRAAAVKVMHSHLAADASFQSRFLHEAKASSDLSHPNIVQIYDFGQEAGRFYLVMELMTDGSLRTLLRDPRRATANWSPAMGVELVRQAADALGYAHERGMIHRDVKPDNLLLGQPPDHISTGRQRDTPVIKICDFGLARLVEGQHLTASGVMMGTPAYMSPEQCQGHPIDGRSDIYSLGVVMYEVLTGSPPFKTTAPSEAIYKHVYVEPPPPRTIRPDLSPELEAIVLRCLAKRPEERFATAQELAQALESTPTEWNARAFVPPIPLAADAGPTIMHEPPISIGTPATVGTLMPDVVPVPPPFPTLATEGPVPMVYLTSAGGETREAVELSESGLTIGRSNKSGITIDDPGVSRHHARIDWDGRQATVTDLHSTNGTRLGDDELAPGVPLGWDGREPLRIGEHWLRIALPVALATPPPPPSIGTPPEGLRSAPVIAAVPPAARISLALDRPSLQIQPGAPAVVKARLSNAGDEPDSVELVVDGVPSAWVTPSANPVELQPGRVSTVDLVVDVPAVETVADGDYPIVVRARSLRAPEVVESAEARWSVVTPVTPVLRLTPGEAQGREQARYRVALTTNAPETIALAAHGDERLSFAFDAPLLHTRPGEDVSATLTVRAPARALGLPARHAFDVVADSAGGERRQARGTFRQTTLVPIWAPVVVALALIGAAVLLSSLLGGDTASAAPSIEGVTVDPANPAPGQPVTVYWETTDAETIDIEPLVTGLDASLGQYTFEDGIDGPKDLTIVAWNGDEKAEKSLAVAAEDKTPTATATAPDAATPTGTSPVSPTADASRTVTPTRTPISIPSRTPTPTATPTETPTAEPTATPEPPTPTPVPPTPTPVPYVPPTNTPVPYVPPTNTPVPYVPPTNTPVPPPTNTPYIEPTVPGGNPEPTVPGG
jgi:serine/threonine protein kinase